MTATTASTHGWQLEEGSAVAYERFLVPLFFDAWARDLLHAAGASPGDRLLDAACGTGIVARRAAERVGAGGTVTGIDINPSMLQVAQQVATGNEPAIRFEEASVDALPFEDAAFDTVLCQQALQFVPDRAAALAEFARVARPGGRLGVSTCRSLEHQPGYRILTDVLRRHVGVDAADMIGSPYTLGDHEEVRALVAAAGFGEVHARIAVWPARVGSAEALLRGEAASSPLGEIVGGLDRDVTDALVADLAEAFRPYTDDDGVLFPFETVVVTATR
jgi:ubiquinone/menaquinone biosynthesis C-methylase UbiE